MIDIQIMRTLSIGEHNTKYIVEGKEIEVRVCVRPALQEPQQLEILEGTFREYTQGDPNRALECYARSDCARDATIIVIDEHRNTTMHVCPHHARKMYLDMPVVAVPREHIEIALARQRAQQPPAMEIDTDEHDTDQ
jgi:hypothetical protein